MSFTFPSIYNFPPLFTKQITPALWNQQVFHWRDIITSYCAHYKIYVMNLDRFDIKDKTFQLFHNEKIQRQLNVETLQLILEELRYHDVVSKVVSKDKRVGDRVYMIRFKTKEQWAKIIYDWVLESGSNNKVFLLQDLIDDDDYADTEFYQLPLALLKEAIQVLENENKAKLFGNSDNEAVKFL